MKPTTLLAVAGTLVALPALAASHIVPALPTAFEPVNLRMTVDSCAFNPDVVRVSMSGNHVTVSARRNQCLVAGTPTIVDIGLGALPAGSYSVSVHDNPSNFAPPYEEARFDVAEPVQVALFPPPPRPLTSYAGMWWNPVQPGWGLSVHQGPTYALLGTWFTYGTNGQPEWYSLQDGRWTSSTTWTGALYRITGPYYALASFDPRLVSVQAAGTATLDFTQAPGQEGAARFIYSIGNTAGNWPIARMPL